MMSEVVIFRTPPDLAADLRKLAADEGISRSECLRRLVRMHATVDNEAVASATTASPINIRAEPEGGLHDRAARGDHHALAELAGLHYNNAVTGAEPAPMALAQAIAFARLAAVHTEGTRADLLALLFLLDQQSEVLRAVGLTDLADREHGQAVCIAEGMAEDGDQEIADMIVSTAASLTPQSLNIAREMRTHVNEVLACS